MSRRVLGHLLGLIAVSLPSFMIFSKNSAWLDLFSNNWLFIVIWLVAILLSYAASRLATRRYPLMTAFLGAGLTFVCIFSLFFYGGPFGP